MITFLIAAALLSAEHPEDGAHGCHVIRYAADGTRTETMPKGQAGNQRRGDGRNAARASADGRGSSVSVSARSNGRGASSASASASSTTDGEGRTITKTQDDDGCTIVIDERRVRGEDR